MTTPDSVDVQKSPSLRTRAEEEDPSIWEWVIGILSTVLILFTIGFLVYKAVTAPRVPPVITAEVREVVSFEGTYVVELWVTNHTVSTAKDVGIDVELVRDGEAVATRSIGMDFLPGESTRRAGAYFPVDPRQYEVRITPIGYDRP